MIIGYLAYNISQCHYQSNGYYFIEYHTQWYTNND